MVVVVVVVDWEMSTSRKHMVPIESDVADGEKENFHRLTTHPSPFFKREEHLAAGLF